MISKEHIGGAHRRVPVPFGQAPVIEWAYLMAETRA